VQEKIGPPERAVRRVELRACQLRMDDIPVVDLRREQDRLRYPIVKNLVLDCGVVVAHSIVVVDDVRVVE
jgi:hypothetical protein